MAGTSQRARIRALLKRAGAARVDPAAVEAAFVHTSAAREHLDDARSASGAFVSNERLEFLGDTILGFVVARWLWARYPDAPEGELTLRKASFVSDSALAETAERLGFGDLLVLGQGQSRPSERLRASRSMLAGAFESFLAALYLIAGLETVADFVAREHAAQRELVDDALVDPKTALQEWTQKHFGTLPHYRARFEGPAQARTYFAQVSVNGELLAEGNGPNTKEAQRAAAAGALDALRSRFDDVAPRKLSAPAKSSAALASKRRRP